MDVISELRGIAAAVFGVASGSVSFVIGAAAHVIDGDGKRLATRAPRDAEHDDTPVASIAATLWIEAEKQRSAASADLDDARRRVADLESSVAKHTARVDRLRAIVAAEAKSRVAAKPAQ